MDDGGIGSILEHLFRGPGPRRNWIDQAENVLSAALFLATGNKYNRAGYNSFTEDHSIFTISPLGGEELAKFTAMVNVLYPGSFVDQEQGYIIAIPINKQPNEDYLNYTWGQCLALGYYDDIFDLGNDDLSVFEDAVNDIG